MSKIRIVLNRNDCPKVTISKSEKQGRSLVFLAEKGNMAAGNRKEERQV